MISRGKFFQASGAVTLGSLLSPLKSLSNSTLPELAARPSGLQLYTVTGKLEDDLDGTLKRIAAIGYRELESASNSKGGYYGLKPKEFAAKAKEFGRPGKPIMLRVLCAAHQILKP